MCWCTPSVRTPCCGRAACHDTARRACALGGNDADCSWCFPDELRGVPQIVVEACAFVADVQPVKPHTPIEAVGVSSLAGGGFVEAHERVGWWRLSAKGESVVAAKKRGGRS